MSVGKNFHEAHSTLHTTCTSHQPDIHSTVIIVFFVKFRRLVAIDFLLLLLRCGVVLPVFLFFFCRAKHWKWKEW